MHKHTHTHTYTHTHIHTHTPDNIALWSIHKGKDVQRWSWYVTFSAQLVGELSGVCVISTLRGGAWLGCLYQCYCKLSLTAIKSSPVTQNIHKMNVPSTNTFLSIRERMLAVSYWCLYDVS